MQSKKAIHPVMATMLLLIVTIVSIVTFQSWYSGFESSIFSNTEVKSQASTDATEINTLIGSTLYFKNGENSNLTIAKIKVNGDDCTINKDKFVSGLSEVDISSCLVNLDNSKPEVVIVTNEDIFSKKIYINLDDLSVTGPIYTDTFISVWDTTQTSPGSSNSTTISLPLESDGTYNFQVDWGDGSNDTITSWNQAEVNHTYSSSGIYTINITGTIIGFRFNYGGDKNKITEIKAWGPLRVGNNGGYFMGCSNLDFTGTDDLNLLGTTDLSWMFKFATNFNGDINSWDVSSVTYMGLMFQYAYSFNKSLNNWDVSSVTSMSYMFDGAGNFNQDLSSWDVSSVTFMNYMFNSASSFNQDLSSWDVSSVNFMFSTFNGANSFDSDISSWNVSNVIWMNDMFNSATNFNQDLSSWDVDQVSICTDFNITTPAWTLPKPNFTSCTI